MLSPTSFPAGFSPVAALYFARVCEAMYAGDGEEIRVAMDMDGCRIDPRRDNLAAVGVNRDLAIVSFRGTATLGGWFTDADARLETSLIFPGRVHAGFLRDFTAMQSWLERTVPRDKPVWICGHSLGGALATLAAYHLQGDGVDVRKVYTFGCPRVGDPEFAAAFLPTLYRVIQGDDPIPHLPSGLRFDHVGEEIRVGPAGDIGGKLSLWQMARALARHALRGPVKGFFEMVEDHGIDRYLAALSAAQVRETVADYKAAA